MQCLLINNVCACLSVYLVQHVYRSDQLIIQIFCKNIDRNLINNNNICVRKCKYVVSVRARMHIGRKFLNHVYVKRKFSESGKKY